MIHYVKGAPLPNMSIGVRLFTRIWLKIKKIFKKIHFCDDNRYAMCKIAFILYLVLFGQTGLAEPPRGLFLWGLLEKKVLVKFLRIV